jgi:putative RNA 2'-phosphotransferase
MTPKNQFIIKLDKFLSYVLGRSPDEFGLVLDPDGYVKIKDLLKAVTEEDGWRHVRSASIEEVLVSLPCPSVEIKDAGIRAICRENLFLRVPAENPPKLLFTCVREKAYPHVLKNGLSPSGRPEIVFTDDRSLAKKIGNRIDQASVTLTIHVQTAVKRGVVFIKAGNLYLADFIPPECLSGPPLPKEKTETKQKTRETVKKPEHLPGGFFINPDEKTFPGNPYKQKKKKNEPEWKKDRKYLRKQKQNPWTD